MISSQNKVIHRFIQPIEAYEEGGEYFDKVIPLNTQAYAIYPNTNADKKGLYYVLGDDVHTYTQIRDGQGSLQSSKEYPVFNQEVINTINKKVDKATTLVGYNITDVYTKSEIDNKISSALSGYAQTASLATVATSGSYNDLSDTPDIPDAYTLPVASDTVLGGVKVDGSTITATAEGVITAASAINELLTKINALDARIAALETPGA